VIHSVCDPELPEAGLEQPRYSANIIAANFRREAMTLIGMQPLIVSQKDYTWQHPTRMKIISTRSIRV
jgi:hypothetical protein